MKNKKAPKTFEPLTFVERPVIRQSVVDKERLEKFLVFFEGTYNDLIIPRDEWEWVKARAEQDPVVAARYTEAKFERELREIGRTGHRMEPGNQNWAYMQADPKRIKRHEAAVSAASNRAFNQSIQVSATLDRGRPEDRESSSWIAIQSRDTANKWWRTYGGNLSGNVPMLPQWCGSGVQEACGMQQRAETAAEFRDKYGDPASINSGRFAGASGSIDQSQFAKERADAKAACIAAGGANCTD